MQTLALVIQSLITLFGPLPPALQDAVDELVASFNPPAPLAEGTFAVSRVIDGDTFVIDMDGEEVTVRLIGVNTPETVDPRRPVQCYGEEASDEAKRLLEDAAVEIETDPSQGDRDKYGRLLAYAILEDGTVVNEHLILEGFGYEYTYDVPYRYQERFKEAQQRAETEQRGLWAPGACAS
jgi:micrococcal nuclease